MAAFPTTVATDADLYIAVNATSTQLTDNPLTSGATTVNVTSTTAFPTVGFISIDNEIIKYTGKTATSFTGCTRGADGTAATSHVQNSQIFHNVIAAHHNALKDDLIATEAHISTVIGRDTTRIKIPNGTALLPSVTFASALDLGLFYVGANTLGISTGGIERWNISTTAINSSLPLLSGNGSVTAPSYSFSTESALGLYRTGSAAIGIASGTVLGLEFNFSTGYLDLRNELRIASTVGTVSLPAFAHRTNLDTGLYFPSTTSLGFTVDAVDTVTLRSTGILINTGFLKFGTNGTASLPVATWESDPDSGLFRLGTDNIALGTNGIRALEITSAQAVKIKGTATTDNATAGDVGEVISSTITTATNFPTSGQYGDLTSILLTAGDWLVSFYFEGIQNGATVTDSIVGIGTSAGNTTTGLVNGDTSVQTGVIVNAESAAIPSRRYSVGGATTLYFKYFATYSVATPQATGRLSAVRIR